MACTRTSAPQTSGTTSQTIQTCGHSSWLSFIVCLCLVIGTETPTQSNRLRKWYETIHTSCLLSGTSPFIFHFKTWIQLPAAPSGHSHYCNLNSPEEQKQNIFPIDQHYKKPPPDVGVGLFFRYVTCAKWVQCLVTLGRKTWL